MPQSSHSKEDPQLTNLVFASSSGFALFQCLSIHNLYIFSSYESDHTRKSLLQYAGCDCHHSHLLCYVQYEFQSPFSIQQAHFRVLQYRGEKITLFEYCKLTHSEPRNACEYLDNVQTSLRACVLLVLWVDDATGDGTSQVRIYSFSTDQPEMRIDLHCSVVADYKYAPYREIQQFLVAYFYFAQNASAFLLCLNRYTAICHCLHHSEVGLW